MTYDSLKQQRYFHWKAEQGDPQFKKLAPEFDKATKDAGGFGNLPKQAPKPSHQGHSRHPGSSRKLHKTGS